MNAQTVIDAVNTLANTKGLDPLEVGPPYGIADVDAVESELGALLPNALREFLTTHGRIVAWEVASTTALARLAAEAKSLTDTFRTAKRFRPEKFPFLAPVLEGKAVAVIIGTTDAASVGYSFVVAHKDSRQDSKIWFFWRDEYMFDEVSADFAQWLDSFLGYAISWQLENG